MVAIQAAARIIDDGRVSKRNVIILSESQALSSNMISSNMVCSYRRYLDVIAA